MIIFHGRSECRQDIPAAFPVSASLQTALAVFRGLHLRSGTMGIKLDERFVLQFAHKSNDMVRAELLDTSIPAFDACDVPLDFAETLIQAAAEGDDVFKIARTSPYVWEHLDMS